MEKIESYRDLRVFRLAYEASCSLLYHFMVFINQAFFLSSTSVLVNSLNLYINSIKLIPFIFSINRNFRIALTLVYLGVLVTLSLMPSEDVPDVSLFEGFDKFVHVCLYFGLAWLLCWSLHAEKQPYYYYLIFFLSLILGFVMEIFQYLMHFGRAFEWIDSISNTSGALIGILIYRLMIRAERSKKHVEFL